MKNSRKSIVRNKRFINLNSRTKHQVSCGYFFIMNRLLLLLTRKPNILFSKQAVIEGVMMRVLGSCSTDVRGPKGKIKSKNKKFRSIAYIKDAFREKYEEF